MASELKVDKFTGVTTAGSIDVTGEGNSTTTNLQQGLAKCWCHSDNTSTPSIDDSFNVGSITDNGNADFSWNWANNMTNAHYIFTAGGTWSSSGNNSGGGVLPEANMTTALTRARTYRLDSLGALELIDNMVLSHGDLA